MDFNNLAVLLREANRHAEAEPLMRRALKIDEANLGPDHPNVATHLNNLAALLEDTNRHAEAEPLYRRAIRIDEASFGPDHPSTQTKRRNLEGLLKSKEVGGTASAPASTPRRGLLSRILGK
jgi:tetratricopeptide (TPR) repeat protein